MTDLPKAEDNIEFVLGTGNHSVICGATTPVVSLTLDDASGAQAATDDDAPAQPPQRR